MSNDNDNDTTGWETPSRKNDPRSRRQRRAPGPQQSPATENTNSNSNANDESSAAKPFLILLIGLPGSGKSTLALSLLEQAKNRNNKYVLVNQDTLGTRDKCIRAARAALQENKCPVVDRCNFNAKQRKWFVELAKKNDIHCKVHCIVLDVDPAECLRRCRQRRNHPTLPPSKAAQVIGFIKKDWRLPTAAEGMDQIWRVTNATQYQQVLDFYDCE
jgi:adenylate kinase family enzyme